MTITRGLMLSTALALTLGGTAFATTAAPNTGVAKAQSVKLKPGLSELKPGGASSQLVSNKSAFVSKSQMKSKKSSAQGYTNPGAAVKGNSK
jgi:hypothetical protein